LLNAVHAAPHGRLWNCKVKHFLFTLSFAEIAVAEYHKKIKEAFEVFDHEANNTVDVR